ncbi:hypothetical protein [Methanosarcina sp. DH2]|uniref:hypothetical protein n=1 Tax=Methanosarcina sp. DH2 TaxID=2605639 RepID=UPI001E421B06|nr:hypothetical protein [Methanosarcina sp. DH2]
MNSLKNIKVKGLRELRDNGLKSLKVNSLKDLMLKPKIAEVNIGRNIEDIEDLTKSREQVKRKIKKLIKEKKEIETRIDLIQKAVKEKREEVSELPWREEIFPPLSRKVHVKISGSLEAKNDSLDAEDTGLSEVKVGGMEIKVKGIDKISEDKTPEDKIPEDTISEGKISEDVIPSIGQAIIVNDAEEADLKSKTGKNNGDKVFSEKEEKIKTVHPFSSGKVNESKVSSGNSSESSIEKNKPESKKNLATSLFGDNLIEDLLNSEDLNPEEEQGFMKYLDEQEVGELITDLKNVRALLTRAEQAG